MKLSKLLLSTAFAVASTGAFAATVAIDDFTDPQLVVTTTTGVAASNTVSTSGAIGDRTITAVGNVGLGRNTTVAVELGVASINNGSDVNGTALFEWDVSGVDLFDGTNTGIDLNILSSDLTVNYELSVNGTSVSKTLASLGTLTFGFAEFGGVDFSNVSQLSLFVSGPTSFDSTFDLLASTGPIVPPPSAVPLPAGGFLVLGGLGALAAVRRRRKG